VQLSELIQEEVIKVGLTARDKWEAIEELVDVLVAAHEIRLADRPAVIEAVNIRERSFSTGLKYGLAVPHGSVDCVGRFSLPWAHRRKESHSSPPTACRRAW